MKIANPIYDVVFRYLMGDQKIAKLILSNIIGESIESLEFGNTELSRKIKDGGLTVLRLDFVAQIKQTGGHYKQVLIELQKAKFPTDIMRFRKYLGQQYQSESNFYEYGKEHRAMPIISIYFLGHNLEHTDSPIVHVKRNYYDQITQAAIPSKETFIESLTHDSYIIQVQKLHKKHRNKLETLLSVFDQTYSTKDSKHFLKLNEEAYPEEFKQILRRLRKAAVSEKICEDMDLEDDILRELENKERFILQQKNIIEEKERALTEKNQTLEENKKTLEENKKVLEEKDKALEEKDKALEESQKRMYKALQHLMSTGLTEAKARGILGV